MKLYKKLTILGVLVITGFSLSAQSTSALAGSEFRAGRIIDDSVFFNPGPFNTQSIQSFLESKVPSCDTNGTKAYGSTTRAAYGASKGNPAPYTCLRDYRQDVSTKAAEPGLCNGINGGNKSAAQIIHEVSQSCGINSRVLIVLLQKEQSLITDDWPWNIQYRSATGYGCPDTAPCDTDYYGFFNQVYAAARGYKYYAAHPDYFGYKHGRNNYIQYNPNSGCSGAQTYIDNQATAGLYIYTPYQPNQAALNNLYGSGDGCSAYGNRNFWRMYNDWFGPTIGPLVRTTASGSLFYSDGSSKFRVGSMEVAEEYGLGLGDVRFVSQAEMDALKLASSPNTPDLSFVVKSNDDSDDDGGNIYLISNGRRMVFTSMDQFYSYGFSLSNLAKMPLAQLNRMPNEGALRNYIRTYNGYLFKMEGGKKRAVLDLETFATLNPSGALTDVSKFISDSLPTGTPIFTGDNLVKSYDDGRLWLVRDGAWHYIPSMEVYRCLGLTTVKIKTSGFSSSQANPGTSAPSASCITKLSTGEVYVMDGDRRLLSRPDWGFTTEFVLSDAFVKRLPVYSPTANPVFKTQSNGSLYVLESGKKRLITSMTGFYNTGHVSNDIYTSTSDFLVGMPTGAKKLYDGLIVKDTSGRIYMIVNQDRLYITSMQLLAAYGYTDGPNSNLGASELSAYPENGTLKNLIKVPSPALIDSGIRYSIPDELSEAYGVSVLTATYPNLVLARVGKNAQITRYIKSTSSPTLYYVESGKKRAVYSWSTYVSLGGTNDNITQLSPAGVDSIPSGDQY